MESSTVTIKPGDVVVADFVGATGVKRRPAIVVSSDDYHSARPDVVLGVVTSNVAAARTPMDHGIVDWKAAGLHAPSPFRSYFGMARQVNVRVIGRLSDADWTAIRVCLARAIG
jgi:mRNA interferase MazF